MVEQEQLLKQVFTFLHVVGGHVECGGIGGGCILHASRRRFSESGDKPITIDRQRWGEKRLQVRTKGT